MARIINTDPVIEVGLSLGGLRYAGYVTEAPRLDPMDTIQDAHMVMAEGRTYADAITKMMISTGAWKVDPREDAMVMRYASIYA